MKVAVPPGAGSRARTASLPPARLPRERVCAGVPHGHGSRRDIHPAGVQHRGRLGVCQGADPLRAQAGPASPSSNSPHRRSWRLEPTAVWRRAWRRQDARSWCSASCRGCPRCRFPLREACGSGWRRNYGTDFGPSNGRAWPGQSRSLTDPEAWPQVRDSRVQAHRAVARGREGQHRPLGTGGNVLSPSGGVSRLLAVRYP